ncbi:hypothetical protein B0J17DRAFT_668732 [Rhizoctonia solani]|nr:hypothetical protein B0J17DRAFT_668732 [Rhizoctonia solani]
MSIKHHHYHHQHTMTLIRVSRSGEVVLTPPHLPDYLSATYNLKPIVGKPGDKDVKTVHTVIRALNAVAHVSTLHNPDLSMQLSQHLFSAQMAIYRANYSAALLPGDRSVYIPPALPVHIPATLSPVVGVPSDEEIKSVKHAVRTLENLASTPHLFDEDVSMKLSQHMFNLQFARYMHDSAEGQFVSEVNRGSEDSEPCCPESQSTPKTHDSTTAHTISNSQSEAQCATEAPSELTHWGEAMVEAIKEATSQTKCVLESMDRTLTLIQRDQFTVGGMDKCYHVYKNPRNAQGIAASEYGLVPLRFGYYQNGHKYALLLSSNQIADYLRFFDIGADLIQGGDPSKLADGKRDEAERLLLSHIGIKQISLD